MASVFAGKKIVLGVTGSVAAFKVAGWVSDLAKEEALVSVVMTDSATRFVAPLTFSALSGRKVHRHMFGEGEDEVMAHIDLGRDADLLVIAPASANSLAKLAGGLADDLLSTAVLAASCKVLIFPAMNSRMYAHPATRKNIGTLKQLGYQIVDPDSGVMACKEEGQGRLVEWPEAKQWIARALSPKDLAGERVLITAGPTREQIDPARFLSNPSSGKMGYELAARCWRRGAQVTLISGPSALAPPLGVHCIPVESAIDMHRAALVEAENASIVIKAAAVADYRPTRCEEHKVKKEDIADSLTLTKNPDILLELGIKKSPNQFLVGFAAESRNLLEEGQKKLLKKNLDLIAINDISGSATGFAVDTNQVLLLDKDGSRSLPHTSKGHTADLILDRILELKAKSTKTT